MNFKPVIVFDMDGVLADVRDSYLATIAMTFEHFIGRPLNSATISEYKESGGWNNDWVLAHELIRQAGATEVQYDVVVGVFQKLFLGDNFNGLILREKWIPQSGVLERLAQRNRLAIFSGRPRAEIVFTLRRFAPAMEWSCIIGDEDVLESKPAPDGLEAVAAITGGSRLTYVGDSVDDARSARACRTSFIGIATAEQKSLASRLRAEGAKAVVESVNDLERIFS